MRLWRALQVAFVVLLAWVGVASAMGRFSPPRQNGSRGETAATSVVVPTAATLPAGEYPWVQPLWVHVGGVVVARLPVLRLL